MLSTSITTLEPDDSSIELNSNLEFRVKDSGATTAKFADGAVTADKLAALNISASTSSGNYSMSTTTFTDVTNLSVSLTTNGRPVMVALISDSSGNATAFKTADTGGAFFRYLRDGAEVHRGMVGGTGLLTQRANEPNLIHLETSLAAGTYTWKVQIRGALGGANCFMSYFKLVAIELP